MSLKIRIRQPVQEINQNFDEQKDIKNNIEYAIILEKLSQKLNHTLDAILIQLPNIEETITTLIKQYKQFTIQEFEILYKNNNKIEYDSDKLKSIEDYCNLQDNPDYSFLRIILNKLTQNQCQLEQFQDKLIYHVTVNQPIWAEIYLVEFPQDDDAWLDAVGCQKFQTPSIRMVQAMKTLSDDHLIEAIGYFKQIPYDVDLAYMIWRQFYKEDALKLIHILIKNDIEYFQYFFSEGLFVSFKQALDDMEFENYYTSIDYILDIIRIILDKQLSKYTVDILNESQLMDSLLGSNYMSTCIGQLYQIVQAIQYRSQSKNTRYLYTQWYFNLLKLLINQQINKKAYDFAINCINNNKILRDRFKGGIKKFQKAQKYIQIIEDSSSSDFYNSVSDIDSFNNQDNFDSFDNFDNFNNFDKE